MTGPLHFVRDWYRPGRDGRLPGHQLDDRSHRRDDGRRGARQLSQEGIVVHAAGLAPLRHPRACGDAERRGSLARGDPRRDVDADNTRPRARRARPGSPSRCTSAAATTAARGSGRAAMSRSPSVCSVRRGGPVPARVRHRAGRRVRPLRFFPNGTTVVLGIVSLEDPGARVARRALARIEEATRVRRDRGPCAQPAVRVRLDAPRQPPHRGRRAPQARAPWCPAADEVWERS